MKIEDNDISRPTVSVKLPVVTLTLADLSFLRSLSQEKSVRCYPKQATVDRLRFLDLIARAKIPPSAEVQKQVDVEGKELRTKLATAFREENWDQVGTIGYNLHQLRDRIKPTEDDVLTEKGKSLLRQGDVSVRVRKVGCAS